MIRPQNKDSLSGPADPFVLPSLGGAALLPTNLQGLARSRRGLAIMRRLFSYMVIWLSGFFPKRMTRDEMLDLADQLRKSAERMR